MAFAEANRVRLRYIPESVWGEVPTSGVTRELRIRSSSMSAEKETTTSEELRADRMVSAVPEVAARAGGEAEFEMSAFSHDDMWQQALLSSWSMPLLGGNIKGRQVTVTDASTITLEGVDFRAWLLPNRKIKLEGFAAAANNSYFTVASTAFTSGNTVLTVTESSLVVEGGSAHTKLLDANDVILFSTAVEFEAGNQIVGPASAFAGKKLDVGQKIYVEGLGKGAGAIQFDAQPAAGDVLIIFDSVQTVRFEFNTSPTAILPGHVYVPIGASAGATRTSLVEVINAQFSQESLRVRAAPDSAGSAETGSIAFSAVATADDAVSVDDGSNGPITFTFGTDPGEISTGASATASAENLANAINASALNVTAVATTGTIALTNGNYVGGAITEVEDDGSVITVVNFAGGASPDMDLTNHRGAGGTITTLGAALTVVNFTGGNSAKMGIFTIAALPDDDTIVVMETLPVDVNAGSAAVVIKGSHLRNRGNTNEIIKQSMAVETAFEDVNQYFVMDGMRLSEFELSVESGEIVNGTWTYMGRGAAPYGVTQLGDALKYTVMPSTSTEVLNATANVGAVMRDGAVLSTAVQSIEIQGNNNCRYQDAVGSKYPRGVAYGRFQLSGSLSAYFEGLDFWTSFINHASLSLGFDFEDVDHNKMIFTIPQIKITEDPIVPEGIDTDVMEPMEWEAIRDPILNTMLMIDRISSVYPFTA